MTLVRGSAPVPSHTSLNIDQLKNIERALREFRRRELADPPKISTTRLVLDATSKLALTLLGLALILVSTFPQSLLGTVLFSVGLVSLVGSWFHDQVHIPSRRRILAGRSLMRIASAPLGVSPLWWQYKHVKLHHRFTSHPEFDPDIQFGKFGRVNGAQPWYPIHRWQHVYLWPLLPFAAFNMLKPGEVYQMKRYEALTGVAPGFSLGRCLLDKYLPFAIFWTILTLIIGWQQALIQFLGVFLITGTLISLITQVQHNTELTAGEFESVPERYVLTRQVLLSSDVADSTGLWWWLCGGVNYHAVHHLIPTQSYLQTPISSARLRRLLEDLGVTLHQHPNIFEAVASYWRHTRNLADPHASGGPR